MRELPVPAAAKELTLKYVHHETETLANVTNGRSADALAAKVRELEKSLRKANELAETLREQLARKDSKKSERRLQQIEKGQQRLVAELAQLREAQERSLEGRISDLVWHRLGLAYRVRRELRPRTYLFDVEPKWHVKPDKQKGEGAWVSVGADPQFVLRSRERGKFPYGWVQLKIDLEGPLHSAFPCLHLDVGRGFNQYDVVPLPDPIGGRISAVVQLPEHVRGIRLDPFEGAGKFRLENVEMTELALANAPRELFLPWAKKMVHEADRLPAVAARTWRLLRKGGVGAVRNYMAERAAKLDLRKSYSHWSRAHDIITEEDRVQIRARIDRFKLRPTISIVVPTWNTPERYLRLAIDSVRSQLYPHWELCIADDASPQPHVRKVLEEYAAKDERIKFMVREKNGHISESSNSALELATGEFVAFLDHDDELTEHALYMMVEELNAHPNLDIVYSDEDKIDEEGRKFDPHFKPDFNPELLRSQNYICHLAMYRASLVREVGGLRKGYEGSQDHDLVLRCAAKSSREKIRHIPHVLYRWRSIPGSTAANMGEKPYTQVAGEKAVRDAMATAKVAATVESGVLGGTYRVKYALPEKPEKVSIIIPTRDGYQLMKMCIESIQSRTDYPDYEILIVDNQSTDPESLEYFSELERTGVARVLRYNHPFNYSAINNFAAREAKGTLLCLLNNDIEVISPDWLTELASRAGQDGVGAVGAKLFYPNDTIQHAGVVTGMWGIAGHVFKCAGRTNPGYMGRLMVAYNVTAVTGACLVVKKSIFEEVGGLNDQELKVAFNDIDFCLKLSEAGYLNVWTPFAELYHHESVSRGAEDTPAKKARFQKEIDYMKKRWGKVLRRDPFYNPNLTLESDQYELAWPPRATRPWDKKKSVKKAGKKQ